MSAVSKVSRLRRTNRALLAVNAAALAAGVTGAVVAVVGLVHGPSVALLVALVFALLLVAWAARDGVRELRLAWALRRSERRESAEVGGSPSSA